MKLVSSARLTFALCGLALAGTSAASGAAGDKAWTVAASDNRVFSVETPCTLAEVAKFKALPDTVVPGIKFNPDSRVACMSGKIMLFAGEIEDPTYAATGPSLFDAISEPAKGDKTVEGAPYITTIDGRRAFVNRQAKDNVLAQTGFVEISRAKGVMLIAGVQEGSGLSIKDQGVLIDHFYGSLKVTGT